VREQQQYHLDRGLPERDRAGCQYHEHVGDGDHRRLGKDARAGETCDRFDNDGRRLDTDRVAGA
jgi:hypothetical protein